MTDMAASNAIAKRGRALDSLTRDELVRLYFADKLSQHQIAVRYGVTQGAILYWFRAWGIQARSHDDSLLLLGKSGRFSGAKNPRWTGGRHIAANGYVFVRSSHHPRACRRGYVREHVLVWEEAHGALPKGWHVHHKNGVKHDNRLENLEAMTHRRHRDVLPAMMRRIAALEAQIKDLEACRECCTCRGRGVA